MRHRYAKRLTAGIAFVATSLLSILICRPVIDFQPPVTVTQTSDAKTRSIPCDLEQLKAGYTQKGALWLVTNDFEDTDKLSYHGYELEKRRRTLHAQSRMSSPQSVEQTYVVLKRGNRTLATFDGVSYLAGNSATFGTLSFPEIDQEELVISLTAPREGRHWVISLSPAFRVLFDSAEYGVGREEFYVTDLDRRGTYEILLPLTAFYAMQDKMYIGEIPRPEIIFKYDAQKMKYLPANAEFRYYALAGIECDIANLTNDDSNYLSNRLDILLRYIYAGKDSTGWDFFDFYYERPDKQEIKSRIQAVLNNDPTYQYLHSKR